MLLFYVTLYFTSLLILFIILIMIISFILDSFLELSNHISGWLLNIYSNIYIFSTNHKYIGVYFLIFCIITFFCYILIYNLLNLERNIFSFFSFFIFIFICASYMQCYIYLLKSVNSSVYLQDLSNFSYYKYILLTIIGSFVIIYFILKIFKINILYKPNFINKLDIKEEIRKILYIWNDGFIGNICCYLYGKIAVSKYFSYIYFSVHFILFYFMRSISIGLLINFVFFGGNLYPFIHTIPIMFLIWLLRFFDYYFTVFREGTSNYLCEIINVSVKGNSGIITNNFLHCDVKDLEFTLTPIAQREGFSSIDLDFLKSKWFTCAEVVRKFTIYNQKIKYITIFLLGSLYICWLAISINFFLS